jgi:hypothetical protein
MGIGFVIEDDKPGIYGIFCPGNGHINRCGVSTDSVIFLEDTDIVALIE